MLFRSLIDARNSITDQTRRHSQVASFLRIPNVIVAVNKMDCVNYSEAVFNQIKSQFLTIAAALNLPPLVFIPMSALHGENVSTVSENMAWFSGKHLLAELESALPAAMHSQKNRCTIQYTSDTGNGQWGFGKVISGTLNINDMITIYPSLTNSQITALISNGKSSDHACAGDNITVAISGNAALKRGDIIAAGNDVPYCTNSFTATICWLEETAPLQLNSDYMLRINAFEVLGKVTEILHKTDISNFEKYNDDTQIGRASCRERV